MRRSDDGGTFFSSELFYSARIMTVDELRALISLLSAEDRDEVFRDLCIACYGLQELSPCDCAETEEEEE